MSACRNLLFVSDIPSRDDRTIVDVARSHGLVLRDHGEKHTLRCPLPGHDDRRPSAVVFLRGERFHCSVCTPGSSLSAEDFERALACEETSCASSSSRNSFRREQVVSPALPPPDPFTAEEAKCVWLRALERARDDRFAEHPEDREVYDYLAKRKLLESWEESAFGIIASDMELPRALGDWPRRGYRIVLPLYDARSGKLTNIQSRTTRKDIQPRTLFPAGSRASRAVFLTRHGLQVVRGESPGHPVILGEGLTDHLALTIHSPHAVVSAAGAGGARRALGRWVGGRTLYLALDRDRAGECAVLDIAGEAYLRGSRRVERIEWPQGVKDAAEALEHLGARAFEKTLAGLT